MSQDPNNVPDQPAESQAEPINSQPSPAYSEQYPPLPSYYEQMNIPDPYGAPVTSYGAAQFAYGAQPATPPPGYGVPVMPPLPGYGVPPVGYGMPPGFGQPPLAVRPDYEFIPPAQPLPLAQAVRELPQQYLKVLTRPAARTFAEEQGKAEWGIIWVQLLFVAVIAGLNVLVSSVLQGGPYKILSQFTNLASNGSSVTNLPLSTPSPVLIATIEVPLVAILTLLGFLAGVGIQYGMAKLFRGSGQYKQQAYNHLLFYIPVEIVAAVLSAVALLLTTQGFNPFVLVLAFIPSLVSIGLFIYSVVLNVFAIMATHRMSGGKATAVVLIPYGVLFVLYVILVFILVFLVLLAAAHA